MIFPSGMTRIRSKCLVLILLLGFCSSWVAPPVVRAQETDATAADAIQWYSMEEAQKLAAQNGKKVMVFAETSWCVYCKKMHEEVFPKQAVIDSMNAYFYPVRIDIESNRAMRYNGKQLTQRQFAISTRMQATPTMFFIDGDGEKLGAQPGFMPAQTFSRLLGFVGSEAFREMEFKKYLKMHEKK